MIHVHTHSRIFKTPQHHSHDYLIRVSSRGLRHLSFEHLYTERDETVREDTRLAGPSTRCTGITEWQARAENVLVSLAWDWVQLSDGALRPVRVVPPRTNLKLIDELGYDMLEVESVAMLWQMIDDVAWQGCAATAIATM